jgi:D-3-phosphoglycerate dehydrogenase
MPKILFTDATHDYLPQRLTELGFECVNHFQTPIAQLLPLLPDFTGWVCKSRIRIDRALLDAAASLRFIARAGVGTEHIDVAYAESRGIQVLTSPEGSRDTVAEHAVGLLLSLLNNLARADRQVRAGQWIRKPNTGVELKGKTVGILGYGNMGTAFAKRLSGFGVRVLAYDKFKTGYGDEFAREVSLETLWQESDVLSIHIPYSLDNHYFIDGYFLRKFRKPVWVLNTARGLVLHTADLVSLLRSGKVLGAALDVLEYEELSFENLEIDTLPADFQFLRQADNVVFSPHIAGWSVESHEGHARVLALKIESLFFPERGK